jgi:hypothetical protein
VSSQYTCCDVIKEVEDSNLLLIEDSLYKRDHSKRLDTLSNKKTLKYDPEIMKDEVEEYQPRCKKCGNLSKHILRMHNVGEEVSLCYPCKEISICGYHTCMNANFFLKKIN